MEVHCSRGLLHQIKNQINIDAQFAPQKNKLEILKFGILKK